MHEIGVPLRFEAAHVLANSKGRSMNLHGHSYRGKVVFAVRKKELKAKGMVIDFHDLEIAVTGICAKLDHSVLYCPHSDPDIIQPLQLYLMATESRNVRFDHEPTHETVAQWILESVAKAFKPSVECVRQFVEVTAVTLQESVDGPSVVYRAQDGRPV